MCEEPSKLLVDPKNIKRISLTEKSAFWVLKYSPGYKASTRTRYARSREEARKNVIASPWPTVTVLTLGVVCLQYKA